MSHKIIGAKVDHMIQVGQVSLAEMREITSRTDPLLKSPQGVGDFYDKKEYADHLRLYNAIKEGKVKAEGGVHWLEDIITTGPGNRLMYAAGKGVGAVKWLFQQLGSLATGGAIGIAGAGAVSAATGGSALSVGTVMAAAGPLLPIIFNDTVILATGAFVAGAAFGLLDD